MATPLVYRFREVHLASAARALMGLSLALLAFARSTAIVFALVASYWGCRCSHRRVEARVQTWRRACGAALGLENSAKSLGHIARPVLGGVIFGASVAVPFWLASGPLLGLAPIVAWSGQRMHEPPSGRAAEARLAFGSQEER